VSNRIGDSLANDASEGQRWQQAQEDKYPEWPHMEEGAARERILAIGEELLNYPGFLAKYAEPIRQYVEEAQHGGDFPLMDWDTWRKDLALWIYFGWETEA
jgi:hypothetical protein